MDKINIITTATRANNNDRFIGEIILKNKNGEVIKLNYLFRPLFENGNNSITKSLNSKKVYSFKECLPCEKPIADLFNLFAEAQDFSRLVPLKLILGTIRKAYMLSDVTTKLVSTNKAVSVVGSSSFEIDQTWFNLFFQKLPDSVAAIN